jgi:hypothetical protein
LFLEDLMSSVKKVFCLVAIIVLVTATGCLTPVLMSPASTPIEGRAYQVTGQAQGESCIQSIMFIPFSTDASLLAAMQDAKQRVNAEALINVVVDQKSLYTFFYNRVCTVVHATGIRFTGQKAPFIQPGPVVPPLPAAEVKPVVPAPAVEPAPKGTSNDAVKPAPTGTVKSAVKPKKETRKERRARLAKERKEKAAEKKRLAAEKKKAAAEKKKAAADKKKAEAEAKKKAEEDKKKAALAKRMAADEKKPIPDQYKVFCKYKKGDPVRVETKGKVIEADFVKCVYFGVRIRKTDGQEGAIPFEQIWMVSKRTKAKEAAPEAPKGPEKDAVKPDKPAETPSKGTVKDSKSPAKPAKPATKGPAKPAKPRSPAKPGSRKPAKP